MKKYLTAFVKLFLLLNFFRVNCLSFTSLQLRLSSLLLDLTSQLLLLMTSPSWCVVESSESLWSCSCDKEEGSRDNGECSCDSVECSRDNGECVRANAECARDSGICSRDPVQLSILEQEWSPSGFFSSMKSLSDFEHSFTSTKQSSTGLVARRYLNKVVRQSLSLSNERFFSKCSSLDLGRLRKLPNLCRIMLETKKLKGSIYIHRL